jgi:hypothetical protein
LFDPDDTPLDVALLVSTLERPVTPGDFEPSGLARSSHEGVVRRTLASRSAAWRTFLAISGNTDQAKRKMFHLALASDGAT